MMRPVDGHDRGARLMPTRVLARLATTGIYLVRGVSREVQRAARRRAVRDGTSLRWVLLQALREYGAGTWTPQPDGKSGEPAVALAIEDLKGSEGRPPARAIRVRE
jgi:hypothetical protein